jgi:hypothetical protein
MDDIWAKHAANAFWMAAARSMEQRRLNADQFQMLLIPGVVCLAFSIELGIKSILLPSGKASRTHNLVKLFGELSKDIQERIVSTCGRPRDAFDKSLAKIANVFEDWRYIYELENPNVDMGFLNSLADAIYMCINVPTAP